MAEWHGKNADAFWNGSTMNQIISWAITADCDIAEGANMQDDWEFNMAGMNSWSAVIETHMNTSGFDPNVTQFITAGTAYTLLVDSISGGIRFSGTALLQEAVCSVDVNDIEKTTYTFMGTGALTYATAT